MALAGKPPAPHSHTGWCLRCTLSLFAASKSSNEYSGCEFSDSSLDCIPDTSIREFRKCSAFTCRQTPHMSIPTPQVPPLPIEVPQPAPPGIYGSDLSVSGLTLWHHHPRILTSWGATTNTRVVRLHAGRADLLLHHLEREDFKSFSFSVTWYWQGF